jgi:hypothetical protein
MDLNALTQSLPEYQAEAVLRLLTLWHNNGKAIAGIDIATAIVQLERQALPVVQVNASFTGDRYTITVKHVRGVAMRVSAAFKLIIATHEAMHGFYEEGFNPPYRWVGSTETYKLEVGASIELTGKIPLAHVQPGERLYVMGYPTGWLEGGLVTVNVAL